MRDYRAVREWYRSHRTAKDLGFNPDHMCLKVCRFARDLGAVYPSAKISQDATPPQNRFYKVENLRAGMVAYFDDPNDSNTFGHIGTIIGRVKGANRTDLNDVLVASNSIVPGELRVVRGTYFEEHWGDEFQFGSNWLNGHLLDVFMPAPTRVDNFKETGPEYDLNIIDRAVANGRSDLRTHVEAIDDAIQNLPRDKDDDSLVNQFLDRFEEDRVIDLRLLAKAIRNGRFGTVKATHAKVRQSVLKILFS